MFDRASIVSEARAMKPWLVEVRRHIHRNPELGLEERQTSDYICSKLDELGVPYRRRATAVVGLVQGRGPSPKAGPRRVVAFRADIDALPVTEATGAEYASAKPGLMHACGHDAHVAVLLGAAKWLSERADGLPFDVKLLFQPAEETTGGAETMIADGCLEDPRVDCVLGLHVMPYVPVGKIETKKGALNGSSTMLDFVIKGHSSHAAYPEGGIDAVMIAGHVVSALHSVVSRYASPLEAAVLSIGSIHGGTVRNVLAGEVRMEGTLRTTDDGVRDALLSRIRSVVEGVSASFGGSGELKATYGYVALVNDPGVVDAVAETAEALLGPGSVMWKEKPSLGVEDFSYFARARPGAFYHLGCGNAAKGIGSPLHAADFDIDEDCLPIGVAMQVSTAFRLMGA